MSDRFTFICAKTSADFIVPNSATTLAELARRVSIFAKGLVGGVLQVGDLKDRPTQDAVANHLLCDGSIISRGQFPQLVDYLAGTSAETATLPNYSGAVTITVPTVTQTTTPSGTVTTGGVTTDQGNVGGTAGGNVPSGGRVYVPQSEWEAIVLGEPLTP